MSNLSHLEPIAEDLIRMFDITELPIPVEMMLRNPKDGMWESVNISKLTGSYINLKSEFSPRMSIARLLAKHVVASAWGADRNLPALVRSEEELAAFARMIIIPRNMVLALHASARTPVAMEMQFEVPAEDAELRLRDLSE